MFFVRRVFIRCVFVRRVFVRHVFGKVKLWGSTSGKGTRGFTYDVVWLVEENDLGLGLRVSAETGSSIPVVAAHTTLFIALYKQS